MRRITAAAALERLRAPAVFGAAAGTVNAVTGHLEGVALCLALVNCQIREADKRLDRLTEKLAGGEDTAEGQIQEPRDVTILRSLPGVGRIVLATLRTEAQHALQRRDYHALRCLSGVAPITKRSGKSKIVLMPAYVVG